MRASRPRTVLLTALLLASCARDRVDHDAVDGGAPSLAEAGDVGPSGLGPDRDDVGPAETGADRDDRDDRGRDDTGTGPGPCVVPLDSIRDQCPAQLQLAGACQQASSYTLTRCSDGVLGIIRNVGAGGNVGCSYDATGALVGVHLTSDLRTFCAQNGQGSFEELAGDVCRAIAERVECTVDASPGWADTLGEATSCAISRGASVQLAATVPSVAPSDRGAVVVHRYGHDGLPGVVEEIAETHGDPFQLAALESFNIGCYALAGVLRDNGSGPGRIRLGSGGPELSAVAAPRFVVAGYQPFNGSCINTWVIDGGWAGAPIDRAAGRGTSALLIAGTHAAAVTIANASLPAPPEPRRFIAALYPEGGIAWARTTGVRADASPFYLVAVPGGGALVIGAGRIERYDAVGDLEVGLDRATDDVRGAAVRWDGAVLLLHHRAAIGADPGGIDAELLDAQDLGSAWSRRAVSGVVDGPQVTFAPDQSFAVGGGARGAMSFGEGAAARSITADERAAFAAYFDDAGALSWVATSSPAGAGPQRAILSDLDALRPGALIGCGSTETALRLGEQSWNHGVGADRLFVARFTEGGPLATPSAAPNIVAFSASSSVAELGEPITVSWDVAGATAQQIVSAPPGVVQVPSGPLAASGMAGTELITEPVRVTLDAIGPGGRARAELTIGAATTVGPSRVVVGPLPRVDSIVSDGTRVYWGELVGPIRSANLDGSDVRTLHPNAPTDDLLLDGDRLRWISNSVLSSMRTDGSDLTEHPLVSSFGRLAGVDGGYAFWWGIDAMGLGRDGIWRMPLDGSTAAELIVPAAQADVFFAVGGGVLVYTRDQVVKRAALDGTQVVDLATVGGSTFVLRIIGGTVYAGLITGTPGSQANTLWSLDLAQPGPATLVATAPTLAYQDVLGSGGALYWRAGPALYGITGGSARLIAVAGDLADMALVPGEILWLRSGQDPRTGSEGPAEIRATAR